MEFGLILLGPAGGTAMLVRVVFGVTMLCLAVPVVRGMWSLRAKSGARDPQALNALWQRYNRGEISWDEYLRGEIEATVRPVRSEGTSSGSDAS